MHRFAEAQVELAPQELPAAPASAAMVEVDDVCEVDPALRTGAFDNKRGTAGDHRPGSSGSSPGRSPGTDEPVEIELSAEQIDALLSNPAAF